MTGHRKPAFFFFLALALVSPALIMLTDRSVFEFLQRVAPPLSVVADLRLTSLFLILVIFLKARSVAGRAPAAGSVRRALALAALWLVGTAHFVLVRRVWVPELGDAVDVIAFMLTGLLAEELLFRGALFDLANACFVSGRHRVWMSPAVAITSVLFSVQHLAYHGFRINEASLTQVAYTLPMGFVFGAFRASTGRVWTVILLHMATNAFTLARNFGAF